jgi:hypothetical protein
MRNNSTHLDFIIHTMCDLTMFSAAFLAYWRFPKLWDYVGLVWFICYCVYHFFTAYLELYNFAQIRLLVADLQGYYIICTLIINSTDWITESIISIFLFGITCYFMSLNSLTNANSTCESFGLNPTDEGFSVCTG